MPTVVLEGLEVDSKDIPPDRLPVQIGRLGGGVIKKNYVRLGPLNVPLTLKDTIEQLAEDEMRSISNICVVLIERGLKYTEEMREKR